MFLVLVGAGVGDIIYTLTPPAGRVGFLPLRNRLARAIRRLRRRMA